MTDMEKAIAEDSSLFLAEDYDDEKLYKFSEYIEEFAE
jgi:hypothetical protein